MMQEMVLRRSLLLFTLPALLMLSSCGKRYVEFTVTNNSGAELHTVELDYPGGSFGTTKLAPGQTFRYRFKPLRDGDLKLIFEDAQHKSRNSEGPAWHENQGGRVEITIDAESRVNWKSE
jgi:hypothetical protein